MHYMTNIFILSENNATMKKLLFALIALPMLAMLASCSDDDNMPNVYIDLTYGNSSVSDRDVYVVKPDTFKVTSVQVTAVNENHKATNGPVSYFLNGMPLGTNPVYPYGISIPTDKLETGTYALQLLMPIYEVDCEMATALTNVAVHVVADAADIPSDAVTAPQRVDYTFK